MNHVPGDRFIVDATPIYPSPLFPHGQSSCLYDRLSGAALGDENDDPLASPGQDLRLCFNCGSPDHAVASCPEPIDRQLVSLSRQLFHFLHPELTGQENARFYIAEGWRQQRLEWLRLFEPGEIHSPLLRDALGLQEGDRGDTVEWLRNIAHWGYPPGWVGHRDPRELVCSRILDDEDINEGHGIAPDWGAFTIFEGADDVDEIDLTLCSLRCSSTGTPSPTASSSVDVEPTRWATYPNTYFSPAALSIYNGTPLGKVDSSPPQVSVTFTPERRALWDRIVSGGSDINDIPPLPPWRMPAAFGTSTLGKDYVPPPPSATPPPLPLTPIPLTSTMYRASTPPNTFETDDGLVVDMDVSDDSE